MKTKILFILLSLMCLGQSHAYDLSKKFGLGLGIGMPTPVWGNNFNQNADAEWGASVHGRYHFDEFMGMDLSVSKDGFKHTSLDFENLNLLAFWRAAGAANLTPIMGLGVGATRIQNYSPSNIKLSFLARAGVEYALTPALSLGALVDYQYVSKILGDMPGINPAHVLNPQLALTWYFGGAEEGRPLKENEKVSSTTDSTDVVSSKRSSTESATEVQPDMIVLFDLDKSTIKPQFFNQLKVIAHRLRGSVDLNGYIEGHADSTGPEEYNDELSMRRAEAVAKKLIEYGADVNRLKAEGFGENRPMADNTTAEGRRKNRRSAVYISVRNKLSSIE